MRLQAHPSTPASPVHRFEAEATLTTDGELQLTYRLEADLARLRLPAATSSAPARGRADGLWRHTCFEAFINDPGSPAYYEFNFAPSGRWAAWAFHGYRAGMRQLDLVVEPDPVWRHFADRLELDVRIRLDGLLPGAAAPALRAGLAAVIEEQSGTISYWALRHPEKQPDFHHSSSFVMELPGRPATETRDSVRS